MNQDHLLESWTRWNKIHTLLSSGSVEEIIPTDLHQLLKETLSLHRNTFVCEQPLFSSIHNHQLLALSAVTILALKEKEEFQKSDHVGQLLQPDVLHLMVTLFQHQCKFIRYEVRRALATLLSLEGSSVQKVLPLVVTLCVKTVTQSPGCGQEVLQLLCSLLSRRTGHNVRQLCLAMLQPHLPEMFALCTYTPEHGSQIKSLSSGDHNIFLRGDSDLALGSGSCSMTSETRAGGMFGQSLSVEPLQPHQREASYTHTGSSQITVIPSSHSTSIEMMSSCLQNLPVETSPQNEDASCYESDCHDFDSLYLFLCLIQKVVKVINTLNTPERLREMEILYKSVLKELTDNTLCAVTDNKNNYDLLLLRKSLDVIDTVLNYDSSLPGDAKIKMYGQLANQIVQGMRCSDCCWQFPWQRIFIGGDWSSDEGVSVNKCRNIPASSPVSEDSRCNPVLVLLLAATLKSCAVIIHSSAAQDEEEKTASVCIGVLLSMHYAFTKLLQHTHSICHDRLLWLPEVCGDQDDRWLEALLCLLDIYVQVSVVSEDEPNEEREKILKLLDPHTLFIQLLTFIHFDPSLFLDWLMSPETCCLLYFTRYLRFLLSDFMALVSAAQEWQHQQAEVLQNCRALQNSPQTDTDESTHFKTNNKQYIMWSLQPETEERNKKGMVHAGNVCGAGTGTVPDRNEFEDRLVPHSSASDSKTVVSAGLALLSSYGNVGDEESDTDDDDHSDGESEDVGRNKITYVQSCNNGSDGSEVDIDGSDEEDVVGNIGEQEMTSGVGVEVHGLARERTDARFAGDCLDRVMCLLLAIREKLARLDARGLMAYNPRPLVALLYRCEQLYKSKV